VSANSGTSVAAKTADYEAYLRWRTTAVSAQPDLSVVIPAYNEEVRIVPTVGAIAVHVSAMDIEWELIVADDGSKDRTVDLLRELDFINLRVLEAERNGGKGSAVRRGVMTARGKYILFSDADNSTPIEELGTLLELVEHNGYDIAVGSRAIAGANEAHKSLKRKIFSGGLRTINRLVLRIGVRDTQCGFKLFRVDVAKRLFAAQSISGFSFDLETLYLASKWGYRIAEVPVQWVDAPGSKVDTRKEAQRFLRDVWKIRMNDLRGVYRGQ
jgi:dolichyl-phosphate beta-glucosyltransferase